METPFGMDYSNPLDVGTHPITQNQTRFIKAHLTQPHVDSFALLRGDWDLALELGREDMEFGIVERIIQINYKSLKRTSTPQKGCL
jgi:hypothetical protein